MRPPSPPNLPTSVVEEDETETPPAQTMKSLTIQPSAGSNGLQKTIDRALAKGQGVHVEMANDSAQSSVKKPMLNPVAEFIDTVVSVNSEYSIRANRTGPTGRQVQEIAVPQLLGLAGIQQWLAGQKYYGPGNYMLEVLHKGVLVEGQTLRSFVVPGPLQTEEEVPQEQDGASKRRSKRKEIEAQRELEEAEAELELARARRAAAIASVAAPPAPAADPNKTVLEKILEKLDKQKPETDIVDQIVRLGPIIAILKDCGLIGAPKNDQSNVMEKILDKMTSMQEKFFDKMTQMQHEATRGKSGAGDAIALLREMNGLRDELGMNPQRDEEIDVDPNNLFGSVVAAGIKGLYGLYRTGAPEIKELIKSVTANINRTPETVTEADRLAYEAELDRQIAAQARQRPPQQQRRLPAGPQAQPQRGPPQQRPATMAPPISRNVSQMPPRTAVVPVAPPVSVQPPVSGVELPQEASIAPSIPAEEISPVDQTQPEIPAAPSLETPPPPRAQQDDNSALMADDLEKELEASMETMLQDIISGRATSGALRWTEEAFELWPRHYKNHLATIYTDNHAGSPAIAVFRDVRSKCGDAAWSRIETALATEHDSEEKKNPGVRAGEYATNNFMASFGVLALMCVEARGAVV